MNRIFFSKSHIDGNNGIPFVDRVLRGLPRSRTALDLSNERTECEVGAFVFWIKGGSYGQTETYSGTELPAGMQVIGKLREAEVLQTRGMSMEEALRQLAISDATSGKTVKRARG